MVGRGSIDSTSAEVRVDRYYSDGCAKLSQRGNQHQRHQGSLTMWLLSVAEKEVLWPQFKEKVPLWIG